MGYLQRLILLALVMNLVSFRWMYYVLPNDSAKISHIILLFIAVLIAAYVTNNLRIKVKFYSHLAMILIIGFAINVALTCHLGFVGYESDVVHYLLLLDALLFFATLAYSYKFLLSKPLDIDIFYKNEYVIKDENDLYYTPNLMRELRGVKAINDKQSSLKPIAFLFCLMFIYNLNERLIGNDFKIMVLVFIGYFFLVVFTYIGTALFLLKRISCMHKDITGNDLYANEYKPK